MFFFVESTDNNIGGLVELLFFVILLGIMLFPWIFGIIGMIIEQIKRN